MANTTEQKLLREEVRRRYAASALSGKDGCCASDQGGGATATDITGGLYSPDELTTLPPGAAEVSLGCSNPTAVADLLPGETVLDLGSGGGIDVLLSARRVGPEGFAYGLDMTDEMLEVARRNAAEAGVDNVEFLSGYMEEIPLADGVVDVVISNCVINLSVDKALVFAEIHRVLTPGGRIGISDIVAEDSLTPEEKAERGSWVGCVAGALSVSEYRQGLTESGFTEVELTPTHSVADGLHSMIIKATKPAT
ncbi:methyltransferase domain-containing protein [soil metagenome]